MQIGVLAKATNTKVETIRFYEAEGLLPAPSRSPANYRIYGQSHLDRLSFIRRSRDLGFTLDQVRALLRFADDDTAPCVEVDAIARAHVADIDRKLADLRALRLELTRRLDTCSKSTIGACRIIAALSPEPAAVFQKSTVR
jgi:DNA-binding transcriptional MerR regulator